MSKDPRGFFETPSVVSTFLCRWAIRRSTDRVLEPCAGTGALIKAAQSRLLTLGQLSGKQIIAVEKYKAHSNLLSRMPDVEALHRDFLDLSPTAFGKVDAVVANPPFVRARWLSKARQQKLSSRFPEVSGRASLWAYFLIHASNFIEDNGRVAFVLPAQLFCTDYGKQVQEWLRTKFGSVHAMFLQWNVFSRAQVHTVLLLCEGLGKCKDFGVQHIPDAHSLARSLVVKKKPESLKQTITSTRGVSNKDQRRILKLSEKLGFVPLTAVARIKIGFVTGCDPYFLLNDTEVHRWRIPQCCLRKVIPSPRQLSGLSFSSRDWNDIRKGQGKSYLLKVCTRHQLKPSPKLLSYLKRGKKLKVPDRFKCKSRGSWYSVPLSEPPQALLSYMSYNNPRLVINPDALSAPNRLHYINFGPKISYDKLRRFAFAFGNSLTLLTAEQSGRSYGGGVLKLEPSNCANVFVPDPLDPKLATIDNSVINEVDRLLRERKEEEAREIINAAVARAFEIDRDEFDVVRNMRRELQAQRQAQRQLDRKKLVV
jgi:hypothetical protein